MSPFELALLCGVVVAAIINAGVQRVYLWIAAGVFDYLVTSLWSDLGLPMHAFFTAMVDAGVCSAIYLVCKYRGGHVWELPLFSAFQLSVLVGFLKIAEVPTDYQYALSLELCNWLALFSLIGAGTLRLANVEMDDLGSNGSGLRRPLSFVDQPAEVHPLWMFRGWHPKTQ